MASLLMRKFGMMNRQRPIKEFANIICPCDHLSRAVLIDTHRCFHILSLPIIKWSRRYYIRYRCCGRNFEVPKSYISELEDSSKIDIDRLKEVKLSRTDTCPLCGEYVAPCFSYCPYCSCNV